jgi:SAM-dependent methyltransferase
MKLDFYRAFEEKYRGPRECIKLRLQVYRQFIEPIKTLYSDLKAVDLGCGRGEWLEVLGEAGFYPHGVDVDDGMLADCKTLGLSYVKEDAITHLKSLPDESQVIVSGIHIAEHLPFNALQSLVIESLRVLKPCGLLILETPNPENIVIGATNFYLDPTHERPIPPELLIFLTDYYGFARSKILRLNETLALSNSDQMQLYDVITGASPDYAVIAQKNGNDADLKAFDAPFGLEFGLTIEMLAQRHDKSISQRIDHTEKIVTMLSESSDRMEVLYQKNTELQVVLTIAEQQAIAAETRAASQEQCVIAAEARANKLQTDRQGPRATNPGHLPKLFLAYYRATTLDGFRSAWPKPRRYESARHNLASPCSRICHSPTQT